ncbi:MAG TPA: SGNH/GDSL hydrolase family protein [Chthoniobacteraceae bacterium]|jgi:acyl-CoA thioesterase-1|nr:SGNH/GDSL hydrolase family protein [Chthoniobacteraceae bacterium]
MPSSFYRLLILGVLAFGAPTFGQQAAPKAHTLIVFGDSITAGGALPKDQADQLWLKLIEKQSAGALTLLNEGKGGRPSASVPEFEQMLARRPKADGLIVALGMNDSRDLTAECVPKAVANVRAMIEKARQAHGATFPVLLLGPTNINLAALGPTKPIGPQREAKLRELGDAFASLATETHCEFISLFGAVPAASLLKDGVHPDAAGNAAIAKTLGPRLQAWAAGFR